jgi:hypothetical protein
VELAETAMRARRPTIEVRAFDDGLAYRYVIPRQDALRNVAIVRERNGFRRAPGGGAAVQLVPRR